MLFTVQKLLVNLQEKTVEGVAFETTYIKQAMISSFALW